ncbi:NAC domain-containing protein 83-like [Mangifera indica]|uniref:NAC domain-containing protein 83-like n=1 Tax=Mangifera indica TaxID=29780 RepID=UPI001CF9B626|nr:NAC domain-containing protein 83-like [Mangifera indica]
MLPTGFRFNPTDEELIQILQRKVYGQEMPLHGNFIFERNVYEFDPEDLQWDHTVAVLNNERYCYCIRENDSREVSGRGWWRATGHVKTIYENKGVVGYKRPLTFHRYADDDRKRNKALKTNWIMHEYSLDSNTTDWRLCKIKYKGKPSVQKEIKNNRKCYKSSNFEASSSIMGIPKDFVTDEQHHQLQKAHFAATDSMEIHDQYGFVGEEQLQSQLLQLDNMYELYLKQNMLQEVIDGKQAEHSKASYDQSFIDGQLHQPADSSDQLSLSLWSWQY